MLPLLLRRLLGAAVVLGVVGFVAFALLDVAPGDATQTLIGESASTDEVARLRHSLGLDRSLPARYLEFAGSLLLHGDLGRSVISGRPVGPLVAQRFGYTVVLTLAAAALAVTLGGLAGTVAAARPGGALDLAVMAAAGVGLALPSYWLALLLMLAFSVKLHLLPVLGDGSPAHLTLPAASLALPTAAVIARLTRAGLLDVKGADYVRTARGKGVGPGRLWRDHMLRNSLIPLVTVLGLQLGHLLGGAFIIETIFAWPGLGSLVVRAVLERDFPVVVAATLLIAAIYQVLNLAVDLLHLWLDPRLRLAGRAAR